MIPSPRSVVDLVRREVGRNAARARNGVKYLAGVEWTQPQPTPKDLVWHQGDVELWRYRSDNIRYSPPVLLFIGLVSRGTIFDLHEKASMVAALRDEGFDVYVLDWGSAGAGDGDNTLETYLDHYLPRALAAVVRTSGTPDTSVVGYCMGGAMVLTALGADPGLPIRNVVTLAAPVDFSHLGLMVEPLRDPHQDLESFIDPDTGCIPAELIRDMFSIRKPTADAVQTVNLVDNLWNDSYVESHQAISRWTNAHVGLAGGVARQTIQSWLRDNALMEGTARLGGRPVDMASITCPVLGILTLKDEIVPPDAARPLADLVGSDDVEMMEIDAGHIGLIVGRSAKQGTFPKIIDWLQRHSDPRAG